jgi:hypothetical protein
MELADILNVLDSTVAVFVLVWILNRFLDLVAVAFDAMVKYHTETTERLLSILERFGGSDQ